MAKPITVKCYLTTYRNEGIEIRRFQYIDIHWPTVNQLKEHVKKLYPQLRGEQIELMYLGNTFNCFPTCYVPLINSLFLL